MNKTNECANFMPNGSAYGCEKMSNINWGKSARDRKIKSAYEEIEKIIEGMPNTDVVWILEKLKFNAIRSGGQ